MDIAKKNTTKKCLLTLIKMFNGWLCKTFVTVITNSIAMHEA